jgi:Inner membrane component of T3SS, cytoplasmic domain
MVRIEITSGIDAGKVVELDPGTHIIGRQASVDLRLEVDSVSGRHLELVVAADGAVRFKDLGSTNGTFSGGLKVQDGEWFAGSEIRLGSLSLKLLDPSAATTSATDAADADLHARARQEAMSGKRRGGPWVLILLFLLVGGAGGTVWYLNQSDQPGASENGPNTSGSQGPAVAQLDLIEDMGHFTDDDTGSWSLPEGATVSAGSVSMKGGSKRISLVRRFSITSASLQLSAEVTGEAIYPLVEWGSGEAESGTIWMGPALNSVGVEIPLPESAEWFQLSLVLPAGATLRDLEVQPGDTSATEGSHENHPTLQAGGNLMLGYNRSVEWLQARSASGTWAAVPGGLEFQPAGVDGILYLRAGPAASEEGGLWILSDGGPIPADNGVVVDHAPGLLLGAGARRLLVRFADPTRVVAREGLVSLLPTGPMEMRWDLTDALTKASRLARQMESASDKGDSVAVLRASSELLRDWPLVDAKVKLAQELARQVMQEGRTQLAKLERDTADASFLRAVDDLESLQKQARELGNQMEGTELEPQAIALADQLRQEADFLRQSRDVEAALYRKRLSTALSNSYPLLAAWLRREAAL